MIECVFQTSVMMYMCTSRKYPYSPTEGIGISWGVEGSVRPKNLKKCVKLYWNFQRGGGGRDLRKNPLWERCGYFLELHNWHLAILPDKCCTQVVYYETK